MKIEKRKSRNRWYHPIRTPWSKVLIKYVRETQGKGTKNISISSIFTSDLVVEKMPNNQVLAIVRISNFGTVRLTWGPKSLSRVEATLVKDPVGS